MPVNQTPYEDLEQIKFSVWLTKNGIRHTASANGGKRNMMTAIKLKRMGVSAGFPDIEIPYPTEKYHGLYIEMKRKKGGTVSANQAQWLEYLNSVGYHAVVVRGFEDARDTVLRYLGQLPII